jgi:hypothetical protein
LYTLKVGSTFASALKARRFVEGRKELISRLKKGLKKTFKKTHRIIWNKECECCTFASALESRAKKRVERTKVAAKKRRKKSSKSFAETRLNTTFAAPQEVA